jgi:hypothetical protein
MERKKQCSAGGLNKKKKKNMYGSFWKKIKQQKYDKKTRLEF